MTLRVSTRSFHESAISQILAQQAKLSRTQAQVASGKRVQTPADDPIAATRILDLARTQSQVEQFGKNSEALKNRLQTGEQALTDVGALLQRVRELAIQANSAAMDSTARASIATEIQARVQELQDISNRRDASGEYLFAGFSTRTQPFSRTGAGVIYAGDQGVRQLQIAPDQRIADGFSGQRVFVDVPEGNGTFTTATGVHNGTGSIDFGQLIDAQAWVRDTYTVSFTATDAWEVRNSANTVVASGAYTPGSTIGFNGAQIKISGAPAAGDSFVVAPAGRESLFTTLDQFAAALVAGADDPQGRSLLNTQITAALGQIDQGVNHAINLRAEIGARLSTVDSAEDSRAALDEELSTSLGELQDLDYAEALSRMNQQLVGLEAAQAAYTRIAQLSLFDYL